MIIEYAEIGIDGNCGFALLGTNLQEGDAEFVEIDNKKCLKEGQRAAAFEAYLKLKERHPNMLYYIGESHPDYKFGGAHERQL